MMKKHLTALACLLLGGIFLGPYIASAVTTSEGSDGTSGVWADPPQLDYESGKVFCSQSARGPAIRFPNGSGTFNSCSTSTVFSTDLGLSNPHGWPLDASGSRLVTLAYSPVTRKVTITAASGGTFDVFVQGVKYTVSSPYESTAHAATEGPWYFYHAGTGGWTWSQTFWNLYTYAPTAYVYWSSVGSSGQAFNELHNWNRDIGLHYQQHSTAGTMLVAGGVLGDYSLNTDTDAAIQFSITETTITDEDIRLTRSSKADGGGFSVWLRYGTSGYWTWSTGNALPFLYGTYPQRNYDAGGGTGWTMGDISGSALGSYVTAYVIATPALDSDMRYVIIPGQTQYSTLAAAQAETPTSLAMGTLPFAEFVAIAQLVFHARATYGGTAKAVLASVVRLSGPRGSFTATAAPTVHNSLGGLQGCVSGDCYHLGSDQNASILTSTSTGTSVVNYLPKWVGAKTLGPSQVSDDGLTVLMPYRLNIGGSLTDTNVSLGVTSAGYNPIWLAGNNAESVGIRIVNSGASGADPNFALIQGGSNGWGIPVWQSASVVEGQGTGGLSLGASAGAVKFYAGARAEQMRLTTDGRLGIGTTNPAVTLDVVGSAAFSGAVSAPNQVACVGCTWVGQTGTGTATGTATSTALMSGTKTATLSMDSRIVTGIGTARYFARWTGAQSLSYGTIRDDTNLNVTVGTYTDTDTEVSPFTVKAFTQGVLVSGYQPIVHVKVTDGVDNPGGWLKLTTPSTAWAWDWKDEYMRLRKAEGTPALFLADTASHVGINHYDVTDLQATLDVNGRVRATNQIAIEGGVWKYRTGTDTVTTTATSLDVLRTSDATISVTSTATATTTAMGTLYATDPAYFTIGTATATYTQAAVADGPIINVKERTLYAATPAYLTIGTSTTTYSAVSMASSPKVNVDTATGTVMATAPLYLTLGTGTATYSSALVAYSPNVHISTTATTGRLINTYYTHNTSTWTSGYGYEWSTIFTTTVSADARTVVVTVNVGAQAQDGASYCELKIYDGSTASAPSANHTDDADRQNLSLTQVLSYTPGSTHTIYAKLQASSGGRCNVYDSMGSMVVQEFN